MKKYLILIITCLGSFQGVFGYTYVGCPDNGVGCFERCANQLRGAKAATRQGLHSICVETCLKQCFCSCNFDDAQLKTFFLGADLQQ